MQNTVGLTPEKIWQAAIANLELEMSQNTFTRWVKQCSFVEFRNDTFLIGCNTTNSKNWLENRLTGSLQRYLSGFLNKGIKIQFIVRSEENIEEKNPDQARTDQIEDIKSQSIELEIQYSSIRNILLEPGRVVRLPVYFFRWLPYVGSQIIFLVMALWQEYYLSHAEKERRSKCKVSVRTEKICQWAGISRAHFFRILQSDTNLKWFARKIDTDYEIDQQTGKIKKSANKYELFEFPLTPGDAEDLRTFLIIHGINQSPVTALNIAINTSPRDIFQYPFRLPPDDFETIPPHYQTVQSVVRNIIGHRLDDKLTSLADQLADHLMDQGNFFLVSWYFLKNWLPLLGSHAAMFLLQLRHQCYFNDETGEIRDQIWINGGYESIAKRLAIRNPRTVANWFPAWMDRGKQKTKLSQRTMDEFSRREHLQTLLSQFVCRIDHRINHAGNYSWKFKVQRFDPLILKHQLLQKAVIDLFAEAEIQGLMDELFAWINNLPNDCFETIKRQPMVVLRLSELTNDCSETLKNMLNDCFETLKLQVNGCFETLLKILKNLKDTLKDKNSLPKKDTSSENPKIPNQNLSQAVDSCKNWSLEKLLLRAGKTNRDLLLQQEKDAIPFVSWIIFGISQPNIRNPFSLAIAKLKENPCIPASGACQRLASLPPHKLNQIIRQYFNLSPSTDQDWQLLFNGAKRERVLLLADLLGLVLDIEKAIE